ncbi:MAG: hypothetical protein K2O45_10625 [Oscillospiraceae bacterium]|nr:hypothetical protein [Oscillospiraceae bacterium]
MTQERDMSVHNKLARQVGGAIACLLSAALLLGLTACAGGQAQEPDPEPPVAVDSEPAPQEPADVPDAPVPAEPVPAEPEAEDEHDGFPDPEEDGEPHPSDLSFTQEEFDQLVADVLDAIVSEEMTSMEKAKAVFDYVHNNIRYTGHADKEDWMNGAYVGLTTGRGDCYTYYAVSRALLTALEIDNLPVERVGGKTLHFWNLVDCGDGWYHFDACPRSLKMPSFLSFMVTDEQVAAFTAMAGRSYYDFDGSLLPERATEIVTNSWPKLRPVEPEEEEEPGVDGEAAGPAADDEPVLPPDDAVIGADAPEAPETGPDGPAVDAGAAGESPAEVWTEPPAEEWPEPVLPDGEYTENAGTAGGETEAV